MVWKCSSFGFSLSCPTTGESVVLKNNHQSLPELVMSARKMLSVSAILFYGTKIVMYGTTQKEGSVQPLKVEQKCSNSLLIDLLTARIIKNMHVLVDNRRSALSQMS